MSPHLERFRGLAGLEIWLRSLPEGQTAECRRVGGDRLSDQSRLLTKPPEAGILAEIASFRSPDCCFSRCP